MEKFKIVIEVLGLHSPALSIHIFSSHLLSLFLYHCSPLRSFTLKKKNERNGGQRLMCSTRSGPALPKYKCKIGVYHLIITLLLSFQNSSPSSSHFPLSSCNTSNSGCVIDKRVLTEDLIDAAGLAVLINGNNDHSQGKKGGLEEGAAQARNWEDARRSAMPPFINSVLGGTETAQVLFIICSGPSRIKIYFWVTTKQSQGQASGFQLAVEANAACSLMGTV